MTYREVLTIVVLLIGLLVVAVLHLFVDLVDITRRH